MAKTFSKGFARLLDRQPAKPFLDDSSPTLLVVDDEKEITASLADQFRRSYHVMTASSADEALSILRRQRVSVIMADQRMPGKTGAELLAEALKIDSEAVRILLTGYADIEAVIQSVNEGKIYFYLTKPWRMDEMDAVISRAMEYHRLLRANRELVEELKQANSVLEERVRERTAELETRARELEEANRKIADLAYRDPLTGLANRRTLEETLAREIERGNRLGVPLAAIMMDIDHFKSINDRYGHAMGDRVLQSVAGEISRHARPYDLVARYGGEEFLIIMPGCTLKQGVSAAERFRSLVARIRVEGMTDPVTASFGVAVVFPGQSSADWIQRTDDALYQAKRNGRNRVEYESTGHGHSSAVERNGHVS